MAYPHRIFSAPALTLLLLGLAAAPAAARPDPSPPPSGEVLHLFGPNSITSHILPTSPAPAGAGNGASTKAGTTPAAGTPDQGGNSMSLGQIAHQMFVTGDPAQEGAAAQPKGRNGE